MSGCCVGFECDIFVGNWREVCVGYFDGRVNGMLYFGFVVFEVRGDVWNLGDFRGDRIGDDFDWIDIYGVVYIVGVVCELFVCIVLVYVFGWDMGVCVILVDVVGEFCGGVVVGEGFICVYFVYSFYDIDMGGCDGCGDDECVLLLYGVFV